MKGRHCCSCAGRAVHSARAPEFHLLSCVLLVLHLPPREICTEVSYELSVALERKNRDLLEDDKYCQVLYETNG